MSTRFQQQNPREVNNVTTKGLCNDNDSLLLYQFQYIQVPIDGPGMCMYWIDTQTT